jgi:hypothetical protein
MEDDSRPAGWGPAPGGASGMCHPRNKYNTAYMLILGAVMPRQT